MDKVFVYFLLFQQFMIILKLFSVILAVPEVCRRWGEGPVNRNVLEGEGKEKFRYADCLFLKFR